MLLLNLKVLHQQLQNDGDTSTVFEQAKYLVERINMDLEGDNKLTLSVLTRKNTFVSIFESGYFDELAKSILLKSTGLSLPKGFPKYIFGVIVGIALEDNNLIKANLAEIAKKSIDIGTLSGLTGFTNKDLSFENEIKWLCKKARLDGELATGLMKMSSNNGNVNKFNVIHSLCKDFCSIPRRVAALVCLIESDLSNISIISKILKIDSDIISTILS